MHTCIALPHDAPVGTVVLALAAVLARYVGSSRVPLTVNGRGDVPLHIDDGHTAAMLLPIVASILQHDPQAMAPETSHRRAADGGVGISTDPAFDRRATLPDGEAWVHVDFDGTTTAHVTFDPVWMPADIAHDIAEQLPIAVTWIVAHPTAPLSGLDIVQGDARARVRDRCNATAAVQTVTATAPHEQTLHGMVVAQAARTPDAIAVIAGDHATTYAALAARAGHFAAVLHNQYGVRPGDRVGLMADRSDSLIVALLGILRAGAAYVPINPRHPAELVEYMLTNAGADVLVVDADSVSAASLYRGELVFLELELQDNGMPFNSPALTDAEDALAYVIYTSGSTGRPKGSAVEHRAICNTIRWRNRFYDFSPRDVVLQIPSFAFDSSVADIFSALTCGATLVMIDEQRRLDARVVRTLCDTHGVTTAILTPGYYRRLLETLVGSPTLRVLTVAGESVSPSLVAAHHRLLPHVALVNEYGPTEASVCTTAVRLEAPAETVPIGRPIDNMQVHIVDAAGRLCGVGMPGELLIMGAGLAREYINQPERTAEHFYESPLADIPGRVYASGDRGCWRADGTIEFFGRVDRQVKVRGFRVELDEIDIALAALPGVRHAAIVTKTNADGDRYLAAFAEGNDLTAAGIRDGLARTLPHYMVPDVVRVLATIPLTLNGKIDRAELLNLEESDAQQVAAELAATPLEAKLRAMCADILQRASLGLTENFFDCGGNSLRVMELTTRVWTELRLPLNLGDVYTYPTVQQLASHLSLEPSI
ncbi:non-ribosomal peptide synthetase [Gemmatimonas sp.]|jgi:amino acid adenylation domain-containing protein|uniref:non-ribosomal peptide synthetase n=1 Tax=Gemmatimonas sp. TaxID=1962908 RepID=UPI0037C00492